jgi:hypothetical protein
MLLPAALLCVISLAPVAGWTIRNAYRLHVFRPLVTSQATEVGEVSYSGFARWVKTWLAGFRGVEDITNNVPGDQIDPQLLPARAFDGDRARTLSLIDEYNRQNTITPGLDAQFAQLAVEHIRIHPLRYYVLLPASRMFSMWFSPRIEVLPLQDEWWPPSRWWQNDPHDFLFTSAYLCLNAGFILLAVWGALRYRPRWLILLLIFVTVRTLFLSTYESCEPRYTLELYPVVLALGAQIFGGRSRPFE